MPNPLISQITLPTGNTYDIKDAQARADIETIKGAVSGGVSFLGITTTALTDGASTSTITIDGKQVSAINGALVIYGDDEFVWSESDSKWHRLGPSGTFRALAFKDSASGKFTPTGTVSQPTFTGNENNVTITATDNTNGNYQPKGTVSQPTFTGTSFNSTGKFTPGGSVSVTTKSTSNKTATVSAAASGEATYTPEGTISQPTFTGSSTTFTGSYTPTGGVTATINTELLKVAVQSVAGNPTYTPAGTVSAPTISVATAGSTTTIKNPTSVTVAKTVVTAAPGQTAPANNLTYYDVADENLKLYQIGYTTGASITTSNVTVKDGDASYTASAPDFTGTGARLSTALFSSVNSVDCTFEGTESQISVSGSPQGTVSQPAFTGTGARLVTGNIPVPSAYTATFEGTEGNISVSGTPTGNVSQPTFTGTKTQISGTVTPTGTVSQPTFTGNEGTVTVS